ncbi:hypothetical protein [Pseudomonas rhodesiae]|uniref:hypothetical protein n=1 Tax=Pseudomonas rhodesiae TaxID=76760 RepID=UPI0028AB50A9|nr:hypothetical protein [Pseudomonas rhodesiae]
MGWWRRLAEPSFPDGGHALITAEQSPVLVFMLAMLVGMGIFEGLESRRRR